MYFDDIAIALLPLGGGGIVYALVIELVGLFILELLA
ncbi:uncharacterized protein METZ01_LOCUS486074, partial [marine metagenome]